MSYFGRLSDDDKQTDAQTVQIVYRHLRTVKQTHRYTDPQSITAHAQLSRRQLSNTTSI